MLIGMVVRAADREAERRAALARKRGSVMTPADADRRLQRWAVWSLSGVSGGLGYPSHAGFLQITAPSTRALSGDEFLFCDPEEQQTDRVVAELPEFRKRVVRVHYLGREATVAEKAKRIRVPTRRWAEALQETLELVAYRLSMGG